ncbi:MAG: hypothetical protein HZC02_01235 [Candidatus Levybacteria bacterium]|nr:hypothetical protein [Candidatus Levybacteria bacterium]
MKAERIILSLIAIFVGLLVAGGAFYIYQMTKQIPDDQADTITIKSHPTPTPRSANFLSIESPKNESIVENKTITITGKTVPKSTIIVSTVSSDQVVKPSAAGNFSLTQVIDTGVNLVTVTAIFPDGNQQTQQRIVSYVTEDF